MLNEDTKPLNFRQHFEAWHKATYGFVGKTRWIRGTEYYVSSTTQARWEAWQACANWHTGVELTLG